MKPFLGLSSWLAQSLLMRIFKKMLDVLRQGWAVLYCKGPHEEPERATDRTKVSWRLSPSLSLSPCHRPKLPSPSTSRWRNVWLASHGRTGTHKGPDAARKPYFAQVCLTWSVIGTSEKDKVQHIGQCPRRDADWPWAASQSRAARWRRWSLFWGAELGGPPAVWISARWAPRLHGCHPDLTIQPAPGGEGGGGHLWIWHWEQQRPPSLSF